MCTRALWADAAGAVLVGRNMDFARDLGTNLWVFSTSEAVASLLSVMRNAAQPFRIPDPDEPFASQTIWRTVIDLTAGIYVYESTRHPNIVWARMDGFDLSQGTAVRKLELASSTELEGGLVGDVTGRFVEASPMQFLRAA